MKIFAEVSHFSYFWHQSIAIHYWQQSDLYEKQPGCNSFCPQVNTVLVQRYIIMPLTGTLLLNWSSKWKHFYFFFFLISKYVNSNPTILLKTINSDALFCFWKKQLILSPIREEKCSNKNPFQVYESLLSSTSLWKKSFGHKKGTRGKKEKCNKLDFLAQFQVIGNNYN